MKTYNISDRLTLRLPDEYQQIPLPFRDEWLTALRSGQFAQTKLMLGNSNDCSYCCLGILCKVQGRLSMTPMGQIVDNKETWNILAPTNPCVPVFGQAAKIPEWAIVRMGGTPDPFNGLAELNDAGATFTEIADLIELLWSHQPA